MNTLFFLCMLVLPAMCAAMPPPTAPEEPGQDWLVTPSRTAARCTVNESAHEITLQNGLVSRTFLLAPNAACIGFTNLMTGASLLRAVKPEAILELNGKSYPIGGLTGQPDMAFLEHSWLAEMTADPNAFHFISYEVGSTKARFAWDRTRHCQDLPWPPPGVSLTLHFAPPQGALPGITVSVHYELYTGIPLLSKWVTIQNRSADPVRVNSFIAEQLAVPEAESIVDPMLHWRLPDLTVATDYSFAGMSLKSASPAVQWLPDPSYTTQVNYDLQTPCLLETKPPLGPDTDVAPGGTFSTFRTFELAQDSDDRERQGLAIRRMWRTIAPWVTENPLMLHLTSTDPKVVYRAMDQCAEVGFEMVIFSFGSGLNMEDDSPQNIALFKKYADYAHSKGLQVGGYSLLASRHIDDADDAINPKTGKPGGAVFGYSPCLESKWGIAYFQHIKQFLTETGFDLLENDGSYPGDVCASTTHPGHHGLLDSQWTQYYEIADFYEWCRGKGIFLNVPDSYFLVGSNKTGMGYRETNWSLPRALQHLHARQNMYDGTWQKPPSMGWMFVPLVQYQGGGAAATIEPLHEHLADYRLFLAENLGYGVQACWRGPRLYDNSTTRALVKKWVAFFKKHRGILESDIIHLRRADGQSYDAILHVNPELKEKGLAMVFNPTGHTLNFTLKLPLYYTGLSATALIGEKEGRAKKYRLDRGYCVEVPLSIPAGDFTWLLIK